MIGTPCEVEADSWVSLFINILHSHVKALQLHHKITGLCFSIMTHVVWDDLLCKNKQLATHVQVVFPSLLPFLHHLSCQVSAKETSVQRLKSISKCCVQVQKKDSGKSLVALFCPHNAVSQEGYSNHGDPNVQITFCLLQ